MRFSVPRSLAKMSDAQIRDHCVQRDNQRESGCNIFRDQRVAPQVEKIVRNANPIQIEGGCPKVCNFSFGVISGPMKAVASFKSSRRMPSLPFL